jgi:hypothetical protein
LRVEPTTKGNKTPYDVAARFLFKERLVPAFVVNIFLVAVKVVYLVDTLAYYSPAPNLSNRRNSIMVDQRGRVCRSPKQNYTITLGATLRWIPRKIRREITTDRSNFTRFS